MAIPLINSEKWYKKGLRFKCTECGKCCTGKPGFVWVNEEEIKAMAEHLQISVEQFKRRYTRLVHGHYSLTEKKGHNFDCVFLEGKRCTIYQARPKQCKTFPWWPENLESKETWEEAAKDCEGINSEAPLVSFEEIEKAVSDE